MAYYEGSKSLQQCEDWVNTQINDLGLSICAGVFIQNKSKYNLELVTSNYNTGYPAFDVKVNLCKNEMTNNMKDNTF